MILIIFGLGLFFMSQSLQNNDDDKVKPDWFNKFDQTFKLIGEKYLIDWKILKAISLKESTLGTHPRVKRGLEFPKDIEGSKSEDGLSWGLMQMTLKTAKDYDQLATPEKLNNPYYSIDLSARHLKGLMRKFTNERDYIMAYNQGEGNQKKFIQLEQSGQLKESNFPQARMYYQKYKQFRKDV